MMYHYKLFPIENMMSLMLYGDCNKNQTSDYSAWACVCWLKTLVMVPAGNNELMLLFSQDLLGEPLTHDPQK